MKIFVVAGALALSIVSAQGAGAATSTTLYNFNGADGSFPVSGLLLDQSGNLLGTTGYGGSCTAWQLGCGTVFKLSPSATGKTSWTRKSLVNFNYASGAFPDSLSFDQTGNLFGTTSDGGPSSACSNGCGVVFELSPPAPGTTNWTRTTLAKFNGKTGSHPSGNRLINSAKVLYGTTEAGGTSTSCTGGCGTVFQLNPPAPGTSGWKRETLLNFDFTQGKEPNGSLVLDQFGNLYGATTEGGTSTSCYIYGCGTVFELSPPVPGTTNWTPRTILNFKGINGSYPVGGLITDQAGNLYGVTSEGGAHGYGTVFKLSPPGPGATTWIQKILFNFNNMNGTHPSGLILDQAGNLYGTTLDGGSSALCDDDCGTVFELSPPVPGTTKWSYKTIVNFDRTHGANPSGGLVFDQAGNLYGTTEQGGTSTNCVGGCGTVFRVTP